MNEFYVTLPSNVSNTLKENSQSDFTTLLASTLDLAGKYSVALVEIDYSNNLACFMGTIKLCNCLSKIFINPIVENKSLELILKNDISKSDFCIQLNKNLMQYCINCINNNIRYALGNKIPEIFLKKKCFLKEETEYKDILKIDLFVQNNIGYIIDNHDSELKSYYEKFNAIYRFC